MNHQALSSFIWSVADLLRGDYKQSEYGKVILPFTVLRRLDCVLEATKTDVLAEIDAKQSLGINLEPFLLRKSGASFYNSSPIDMKKLIRNTGIFFNVDVTNIIHHDQEFNSHTLSPVRHPVIDIFCPIFSAVARDCRH